MCASARVWNRARSQCFCLFRLDRDHDKRKTCFSVSFSLFIFFSSSCHNFEINIDRYKFIRVFFIVLYCITLRNNFYFCFCFLLIATMLIGSFLLKCDASVELQIEKKNNSENIICVYYLSLCIQPTTSAYNFRME